MSNTFLTPTDIVRDASLFLADNLVVANLANHSVESRFAQKVGTTVYVKVPPDMGTADEFTSTTSASNITETNVGVTIQKHFYKRVTVTSEQLTYSLDDFNTLVMMPAVRSLIRSIEVYMIARIMGGFSRHIQGTSGTAPSTHAHLLAAEQEIYTNRGRADVLYGLLTPAAYTSYAQLEILTSGDYGADRPTGLRENRLGKLSSVELFRSPNAGDFTRGDVAGTVLTDGDPGTTNTIHVDDLTAATGTIYEGTQFTVADDSSATVYTVTADATIASNEVDLVVTPAADASIETDKAVTFISAPKTCVVWNPAAVAAAIIPPAPILNSVSDSVNGLGLRIIQDSSISTLANDWVFDCYCGARVVRNEFGAVFQG